MRVAGIKMTALRQTNLLATLLVTISTAFLTNTQAQTAPTVKLVSGTVRGTSSAGIDVFRGIPYVAPPVGILRWRPPQPIKAWDGIRDATDFGSACMQSNVPFTPPLKGMSEDCLTINVWRPAAASGAKRPVMVWIHGGGFYNGTSGTLLYDGAPFAKQGVLFVSFNYRVGRFGFFAHPALTQEHPEEPLGNYGFMDQIAALQWVRGNIAAFGGDPENVTIFGESAGARSVDAMLIAPDAKGLFQKAIIESTTHGWHSEPPVRRREGSAPSGESIGEAFLDKEHLGHLDAAALRALPAATIVSGLGQTSPQPTTFSMVDSKILTNTFARAFEKGAFTPVPLIIGTNDYEAKVFEYGIDYDGLLKRFGANRDPLMKAYEGLYPDPSERSIRVMTEAVFYEPTRAIVRSFARKGQSVYFYRFPYRAEALRSKTPGALHASELPFVFDNLAQTPATSMGPAWTKALFGESLTFTDHDLATAKSINGYWINFAKTGNPNGPGLPKWTPASAKPNSIMDFRETGPRDEPDPAADRLDLIEPANLPLRQ
jgi:para-nitrobenzyl esterase